MDLGELRTKLYSRLVGGINNFKTAIGGRLYFHQAELGVTLPCVIYDFLPLEHDRDTGSNFYYLYIQFLIAAETMAVVEDIGKKLMAELDNGENTFSFTTYKVVEIKPMPTVYLGITDKVWNIAVNYKFLLQL